MVESTNWTNTFHMLADEFAQIYGVRPSASPEPPDLVPQRGSCGKKGTPKTRAADLKKLHLDFHDSRVFPRTAICLSGGGIRSASFGLGVLQFLAEAGLLHRFEYISTVSGGGYIGSWLSAWLARLRTQGVESPYAKVCAGLAERIYAEEEAPEIDALRANSNYLTPKLGAFSADTWSALAIWARNLIINWFLLIPLICAAAVTPQIFSALGGVLQDASLALPVQILGICFYLFSLTAFNGARPRWQAFGLNQPAFLGWCLAPLILAAIFWAVSTANASKLPSIWHPLTRFLSISTDTTVIPDYIILAVLLYGIAVAIIFLWDRYISEPYVHVANCTRESTDDGKGRLRFSFELSGRAKRDAAVEVYTEDGQAAAGKHYKAASRRLEFAGGTADASDTLGVELTGYKIGDKQVQRRDLFVKFRSPDGVRIGGTFGATRAEDVFAFLSSGICFGLFLGVGNVLFRHSAGPGTNEYVWHHLLWSTFAVPWLLLSHALATVVFLAITSWLPRSDEEREWIGRAVGWVLIVATGWAVIAGLVLLLPKAVADIFAHFEINLATVDAKAVVAAVVSVLGVASGIFTAAVGGSPKTPAVAGLGQQGWRKLALYLGAPAFLASLFVGLSLAVDILAFHRVFAEELATLTTQNRFCAAASGLVLYGIAPAAGAALAGYFININRFSLHEMYRNRLVRAFLGASNTRSTQRDLFTFFNFTDNLPMSRLWMRRDEGPLGTNPTKPLPTGNDWRPFHIINIALNLVSTDKPAWQERKAESFTVSPLWCGSAQLDAFRRTSEYGGKRDPLTLGTAMAISGAAVSPNMGYNSSPLITFLLTLFNVRLGWWLGNPKYQRFTDEGPRWAAVPLLAELFGLTNDKRNYVYLSDGGHFENLGLYEMVRRRCHLIIVSDAGQDKDLAFADLANAVRKIYIDLGVRIEFPKLEELRVRNKDRNKPKEGGPCYTVGRIRYSEADSVSGDKDGYVLYMKPGFRGDEPADIVGYAAESTDFPHETTIDQWFSESQFESYRGLGLSITKRAHNAAVENYNSGKSKDKQIKNFQTSTTLEFFESLSMVEMVDPNSTYIGAAGPPSS